MSNYDPAFPTTQANYDGMEPAGEGMTLRDYFAAKALAAFITEPIDGMQEAMIHHLSDATCSEFAEGAYKMADAMLKAREA